MSEMSCKTCRRWAAGWCLAQQLGTSRDEVCNAWELSQVVEWEDKNEKLQSRITELKEFIDQLIEVGDAVINAEPMWIAEEDKWETLVKDWKEREE